MEQAKAKNMNLKLPVDTVIADAFDNNASLDVCDIMDVPFGWMGLDVDDKSIA